MYNQHAGLSQQLAAQRITERQEQAAQSRLAHGAGGRQRRRRRRWGLAPRWWLLGRRPAGRPAPTPSQLTDRRHPCPSSLEPAGRGHAGRISLAGTTTLAHAQATDQPSSRDARRPPTQGQVGEAWHRRSATSPQKTTEDATLGRSWPENASPSPTRHPPSRPLRHLSMRMDRPPGSSSPSVRWLC